MDTSKAQAEPQPQASATQKTRQGKTAVKYFNYDKTKHYARDYKLLKKKKPQVPVLKNKAARGAALDKYVKMAERSLGAQQVLDKMKRRAENPLNDSLDETNKAQRQGVLQATEATIPYAGDEDPKLQADYKARRYQETTELTARLNFNKPNLIYYDVFGTLQVKKDLSWETRNNTDL